MICRFAWQMTILSAIAATVAGCTKSLDCPPPVSMAEYVCQKQTDKLNCSGRSLLAYNAQRVADDQLTESQRLDSLGLVQELYDGDPNIRAGLSIAMDDPNMGAELRESIHIFLLAHPPTKTGSFAQDLPAKVKSQPQAGGATIR